MKNRDSYYSTNFFNNKPPSTNHNQRSYSDIVPQAKDKDAIYAELKDIVYGFFRGIEPDNDNIVDYDSIALQRTTNVINEKTEHDMKAKFLEELKDFFESDIFDNAYVTEFWQNHADHQQFDTSNIADKDEKYEKDLLNKMLHTVHEIENKIVSLFKHQQELASSHREPSTQRAALK